MGKQKTLKQLREAAKLMPTTYVTQAVTKQGIDLIRAGFVTDHMGKPIVDSKVYVVDEKVPANNYEMLKKHYYKGGMPAVNKFLKELADFVDPAKPTPSV